MTDEIYEHNGWKLLRLKVPEGPLRPYSSSKPWCTYFEFILKQTKTLPAGIVLGEVGGKGGYDLHEDTHAAYEIFHENRGGKVLFGAAGPAAIKALRRIEKVLDATSEFWRNLREEGLASSLKDWKHQGLPPCPPPQADWKPVFLRFGDLPPDGYSRVHTTGTKEPGVSVFRAYETPEGDYLIDLESRVALACDFLMLERQGRPAFIVEGEEVDEIGWGGEPTLTNIRSCNPVPHGARIDATVELSAQFRARARKKLRKGYSLSELPRRLPFREGAGATYSGDAFEDLLAAVWPYASVSSQRSRLHGPKHWRRVARNVEILCESTPGADLGVAILFAALHDSARDNDGHDPGHGRYAAETAELLHQKRIIEATDEQMDLLVEACRLHAGGYVAADPTIGACWDADRLDLPRCGIKPDPRYLSTEAAKEIANHSRED